MLCVLVAAVASVGIGAIPARADTVSVGPCQFNLGYPHLSTRSIAGVGMTVMRAHVVYKCTHKNLIYVNAQSTMRYCGPSKLPALSCQKTGGFPGDSNQHTNYQNNIHVGSDWSDVFTTSDSDPNPEPGWYVATAAYEICPLNGGAAQAGVGTSNFVHLDSDGKVKVLRDFLNSPAPAPEPEPG